MRIRVTAILVAKHGGEWLEQTLAGLATQTRLPDRVVAVVNGGKQSIAQQITERSGDFERSADFGEPIRIVATQTTLAFGAAVEQGVLALPAEQSSAVHNSAAHAASGHGRAGQAAAETAAGLSATSHASAGTTTASPAATEPVQDWFWLLTEDSAPEAAALEEILATVQRAPSVVVAGPKLVNWQHPDRIIELGQSLTQRGDRWLLRRQERDQQQYDHLQDVLGVGPVGMLVRADVWRELRGFDPAYPVYDDALDFSVRARLAGHRVVVSPTSRVRFAQLGVAGPRIERSRRVLRVAHRQARTADLHRRIAYAPAITAFFMWLGLPFVAIARVAWSLIREQPGNMWGEFAAALRVFFRPAALAESRRRLKQANTSGWGAVDPLRVDSKSVRTARMIDREVILASQGRLREDLNFVSSGGLATLVVASLLTLGLTWWAVTQTSLTGGGLAPLSSLGDLWTNTQTQGGVPADAFSWVLALLGTLTFYNPSHAVVLMLVAAIPLAALGGFIWAAQLTKNSAGRVLVAFAWAFSPVLLGSLAAGRLPTLILAVVLPWLLLAATRARVAWSWAGVASLLAAVALACAPVLIPAAVVLLVVGIMSSPRGTARVLTVAIGPLVLFAPNIIAVLRGADPLGLLRDPGITPVFTPGNTWHLLVGFPEFGLEGWGSIFAGFGLSALPATALVGVLLLPIVLLAGFGLITGKVHFTLLHAVLGGVGLLTAVGSSRLQLTSVGAEGVAVWTGSGLALYWIAVLGLAAVGTTALRKAAVPIVAVGLVTALIAVAPTAVKLATGSTGLAAGETQMPAIVQAAGSLDPDFRTLVLTTDESQEATVRAQLVLGPGVRLDRIRTADSQAEVTEQDQWIAQLVAVLASTGDEAKVQEELHSRGIGFVLLSTEGSTAERSQLQSALDRQTALENAGSTAHGLLWRVIGVEPGDGAAAAEDEESGDWLTNLSNFGSEAFAKALWWAQIVVLAALVLLALPTGAVVERPERPERPGRDRKKNAEPVGSAAGAAGAGAAGAGVAAETAVDVFTGDDEISQADPEGFDVEPGDTLEPGSSSEPVDLDGRVEPGDVVDPVYAADLEAVEQADAIDSSDAIKGGEVASDVEEVSDVATGGDAHAPAEPGGDAHAATETPDDETAERGER